MLPFRNLKESAADDNLVSDVTDHHEKVSVSNVGRVSLFLHRLTQYPLTLLFIILAGLLLLSLVKLLVRMCRRKHDVQVNLFLLMYFDNL